MFYLLEFSLKVQQIKAGLDEGDIVVSVNGEQVESRTRIEEIIANSYPGNSLAVTVKRGDKRIDKNVVLDQHRGNNHLNQAGYLYVGRIRCGV